MYPRHSLFVLTNFVISYMHERVYIRPFTYFFLPMPVSGGGYESGGGLMDCSTALLCNARVLKSDYL
jgi:hypothetical protein